MLQPLRRLFRLPRPLPYSLTPLSPLSLQPRRCFSSSDDKSDDEPIIFDAEKEIQEKEEQDLLEDGAISEGGEWDFSDRGKQKKASQLSRFKNEDGSYSVPLMPILDHPIAVSYPMQLILTKELYYVGSLINCSRNS